jgi:hypothetical protein
MPIKFPKIHLNSIMLAGIHLLIYFCLYCVLSFLGFIKGSPSNATIIHWDAFWYQNIVNNGYSFAEGHQSNIAFFPLFPMLWKVMHLSPICTSLLNLVLMISGMMVLRKLYNLSAREFMLLLSVPALFYCYIPYSEATFFLAGTLIIYGLQRDNKIALLGVFLACLARSASLIFIPLILFVKFYNYRTKKNNRQLIIESVLLIVTAIVSTLLVQTFQYVETGKFFAIFETQKEWHRILALPELYLTTWDGARLIWLDGLAFFTGLIALSLCCIYLWKKINHHHKTISPAFLFSLGYLAMVSTISLLYSGKDLLGGTSIYSINRFVFATPFFMVFLIMCFKNTNISRNAIVLFLIISVITWTLFNAFGFLPGLLKYTLPFMKTKIYFGIIFLYSLLFLLMMDRKIKHNIWSGVYLLNLILQIFLFNAYLNDLWIG